MTDTAAVDKTVREYLEMVDKLPAEYGSATSLMADGAGLDSLEIAELSAILEDEYGTDPYSAGQTPTTVGEILEFYRALTSSS